MKPPNDLKLAAEVVKIQALARQLNEPPSELALFILLSDIHMAAERAESRLNDLLYGRGYEPPQEQMGG
jgi:hypothetical protein